MSISTFLMSQDTLLVLDPLKTNQCAKKVVSDSPGLVDFATGLVNSVLNLPDGQVKFFGKFTVISPAGYIK